MPEAQSETVLVLHAPSDEVDLEAIWELDQKIKRREKEVKELKDARTALIEEAIHHEVIKQGNYEIITPAGTRIIPPDLFRKLCDDATFLKCCTVNITKAESAIGKDAIDEIALAGKPQAPKITYHTDMTDKVRKWQKQRMGVQE